MPTTPAEPASLASDRRRVALWLGVAVGSLVLAGSFALLLVVGRVPPLSGLLTDPAFFKRCLVVHVNLALGAWFYAFIGALFALIPSHARSGVLARHSPLLAVLGVGLLLTSIGLPGAKPVLSNYIPALDHPVFLAGLVAIASGLTLTLLDARLLPSMESPPGLGVLPSASTPLLRAGAIAFLLALLTFVGAGLSVPEGLLPEALYESVMWGGGHVLQFASVAAMLAVWVALLTPVLGAEPIGRGTAAALGGVLITPLFAAPILALSGTDTVRYHVGFTRLMQFGIAPVVLVLLALCLRALARRRSALRLDVRITGFVASALLTVLGFTLGALIHGSNTVVPAHYHASIGGVTVAFMALTPTLLEAVGRPIPEGRLSRLVPWQPVLLGAGQLIFAAGFALAGAQGMQRKAYASEQHIRTAAEYLGLGVMGLGGLIAVAGGVLFLILVGAAVRRSPHNEPRGETWPTLPRSLPSNN